MFLICSNRDFGNIGAHAGSGELTEKEIPIVNALCNAILEYVYSAPYLATLAENKLQTIKKRNKKFNIMPIKFGFIDDNKVMDIYINENGKLYISIGAVGENIHHNGYIILDKDYVKELIQGLVDIEKEMVV